MYRLLLVFYSVYVCFEHRFFICGVHQGTDRDRVVQIAKMFADIAKFAELKQSFQSRECLVSIFFLKQPTCSYSVTLIAMYH